MRHITPSQLQQLLQDGGQVQLLDVREPWEFDICHIQNSLLVPMGQIPVHHEQLDPQQTVVVICHHGIRSQQVALYLHRLGYSDV
ncbi:MAG: rhodanese-like domain-containing protein, partial [Gammaproteobacteria bacterium]|nr:rhodanese-like domain-containing protein [Gammaproteobacteria bacterium]